MVSLNEANSNPAYHKVVARMSKDFEEREFPVGSEITWWNLDETALLNRLDSLFGVGGWTREYRQGYQCMIVALASRSRSRKAKP